MSKIEISDIVNNKFDKINYDKTIKRLPDSVIWEAEARVDKIVNDILGRADEKSIFEIIWWLLKQSPKIIKLIIFIINLKEKSMTQSTLDTIKGIVRLVISAIGIFGVAMSPENTELIVSTVAGIWGVVELILGLLSNSKHIAPPN